MDCDLTMPRPSLASWNADPRLALSKALQIRRRAFYPFLHGATSGPCRPVRHYSVEIGPRILLQSRGRRGPSFILHPSSSILHPSPHRSGGKAAGRELEKTRVVDLQHCRFRTLPVKCWKYLVFEGFLDFSPLALYTVQTCKNRWCQVSVTPVLPTSVRGEDRPQRAHLTDGEVGRSRNGGPIRLSRDSPDCRPRAGDRNASRGLLSIRRTSHLTASRRFEFQHGTLGLFWRRSQPKRKVLGRVPGKQGFLDL